MLERTIKINIDPSAAWDADSTPKLRAMSARGLSLNKMI
jgi:hypothetical protein